MKYVAASLFAFKCRTCGTKHPKGVACYYDANGPKGQKVECLACHAQQPAPQAQQPEQPAPEPARYVIEWDSLDAVERAEAQGGVSETVNYQHHRVSCGTSGPALRHDMREFFALDDALYRDHIDPSRNPVGVAKHAMRAGWPAGVEVVQGMTDELRDLVPAPVSVRRKLRRGPFGDALDIRRVLGGDLDRAWDRRIRASARAPRTITLHVAPAINADQDARIVLWRGATCVCLADMLTEAGYSVGIEWVDLFLRSTTKGEDCSVRITVKAPTAPLDMAALAGSLCSPAWVRSVYFLGVVDEVSRMGGDVTSGGGRCGSGPVDDPAAGVYAVPSGIATREQAVAAVRAVLSKIEGADAERAAA